METFWQDVRYSLRTLLKRPGFTLTVVITLALGIGANATIFTWIKAVLLESLPGIERPEELVEIWGATRNNSALSLSYLDYLDLRDRNEVLSGLIAHQMLPLNLGRGGKPERVQGSIVSGNYFHDLGVRALIGSTFAGATIDLWTPVMMKDYLAPRFSLIDRGSRWLMVMGRLKPGSTLAQAQGNLTAISGQLQRTYPQTNDQMDVAVYSLTSSPFSLKGSLRSSLAILMAAVAVVLLIACANVANLLLGRAASRRKEI